MTRDSLLKLISQNLAKAGITDFQFRAQPDSYGSWNVAVVAEGFKSIPPTERRAIVLASIPSNTVEWIDLLTAEESKWAGTLPADLPPSQLPLWPEALARSSTEPRAVFFPSDLDDDIPPPFVATFYSLRGGVGRSTALANVADILSRRGYKVVCVDADLEAPGLASLFGKEDEVGVDMGVVSLLTQLDAGLKPDISAHLIRVSGETDLYCLPAGKPSAEYARLLRFIDPTSWYREDKNPLRALMEGLSTGLPFVPDVILIDSRTGISPLSAPLLFDVSDMAVVVFFPHPQAKIGTGGLVDAVLSSKTGRKLPREFLTPEIRFIVSPVPGASVSGVVQRYQARAYEWISTWLGPTQKDGASLVESEITHFVPYLEAIATADVVGEPSSREMFKPAAEWVQRFLPTRAEQVLRPPSRTDKSAALKQFQFSGGTAEEQSNFKDTFVETEIVKAAISPSNPLVLGRKGTGKTALFRRLAEAGDVPCIAVHAPAALRGNRGWILGPDGFDSIDKELQARKIEWRHFWVYYVCVAVARHAAVPVPFLPKLPATELDTVNGFRAVCAIPDFSLQLLELFGRLDSELKHNTFVLFDGLDTGFGSTEAARSRRSRAIEGLFELWADRADSVRQIKFKILLREDIWRTLVFQNKSHLHGRTVALHWKDQSTFFKVVLKQAVRSDAFRALLASNAGRPQAFQVDPDLWTDTEVSGAWNLLVGERMKGGKTAFTRNWVWNRLADANDDHSPRYLIQLFRAALERESSLQGQEPYERTMIRPRALIEQLPRVSEEALGALKEEFPELEPLLARLQSIGQTPFDASEVGEFESVLKLALEIGLIGAYEGIGDEVFRYRVPELYRYALSMTRPGQA